MSEQTLKYALVGREYIPYDTDSTKIIAIFNEYPTFDKIYENFKEMISPEEIVLLIKERTTSGCEFFELIEVKFIE